MIFFFCTLFVYLDLLTAFLISVFIAYTAINHICNHKVVVCYFSFIPQTHMEKHANLKNSKSFHTFNNTYLQMKWNKMRKMYLSFFPRAFLLNLHVCACVLLWWIALNKIKVMFGKIVCIISRTYTQNTHTHTPRIIIIIIRIMDGCVPDPWCCHFCFFLFLFKYLNTHLNTKHIYNNFAYDFDIEGMKHIFTTIVNKLCVPFYTVYACATCVFVCNF